MFDDNYGFDDNPSIPELKLPDGWKLVKTCIACPEQYELFTETGRQVGYFRLRHGEFRVDYPECSYHTVYETWDSELLDGSDGIFTSDEVRVREMQKGVDALVETDRLEHGVLR